MDVKRRDFVWLRFNELVHMVFTKEELWVGRSMTRKMQVRSHTRWGGSVARECQAHPVDLGLYHCGTVSRELCQEMFGRCGHLE